MMLNLFYALNIVVVLVRVVINALSKLNKAKRKQFQLCHAGHRIGLCKDWPSAVLFIPTAS